MALLPLAATVVSNNTVAAASPDVIVARDGRGWAIHAQRQPRAEVAAQLARLSGSTLRGDLQALAQARPVTLNWRGGSLDEAWQQLLDGEVSHARRCSAARCELWLVAGPVAFARRAEPPTPSSPSVPRGDPPGLFPSD